MTTISFRHRPKTGKNATKLSVYGPTVGDSLQHVINALEGSGFEDVAVSSNLERLALLKKYGLPNANPNTADMQDTCDVTGANMETMRAEGSASYQNGLEKSSAVEAIAPQMLKNDRFELLLVSLGYTRICNLKPTTAATSRAMRHQNPEDVSVEMVAKLLRDDCPRTALSIALG